MRRQQARLPEGARRLAGDDGVGTVLSLAVIAMVLLATALALLVGAAVAAKHRVGAVADFAALAAAQRAAVGDPGACRAASALAARGGAHVTGCRVRGAVVEVTAVLPLPGALARWGWVTGRARAGTVVPGTGSSRPGGGPIRDIRPGLSGARGHRA